MVCTDSLEPGTYKDFNSEVLAKVKLLCTKALEMESNAFPHLLQRLMGCQGILEELSLGMPFHAELSKMRGDVGQRLAERSYGQSLTSFRSACRSVVEESADLGEKGIVFEKQCSGVMAAFNAAKATGAAKCW